MKRTRTAETFPSIHALAAQYDRPVVVLDLEATGFLGRSMPGIVEYACLVVPPQGEARLHDSLVNPGMPIPWQATRIHGIANKDVADQRDFSAHADLLNGLFEEGVIVGFNSRIYDVEVVIGNGARYGLTIPTPEIQLDVRDLWLRIMHTRTGTLSDVARHFEVEVGEAHRARSDVLTTARVLEAMLNRYGLGLALDPGFRTPRPERSAWLAPPAKPQERLEGVDRGVAERGAAAPNKSRRARDALLELVERVGGITSEDCLRIAEEVGCASSTVGFQVCELLDGGHLQPEHVVDAACQARIAEVLADVIEEVGGSGRLKPIKEALDRRLGEDVSYIQLKVALAGEEGRRDRQPDFAPQMVC